MQIDFSVSPASGSVGVADTISLTVTMAGAAARDVLFCAILFIPTGYLYPLDPNKELFYGNQGIGGLIIEPINAGCLIPSGSTTGTISILGSSLGVASIGITRNIYVLPYNTAIGICAGSEVGLPATRSIVDKYIPISVTVLNPPPPFIPPTLTQTNWRIFGALGLPVGGGSPRLYATISRDITPPGGVPTTTALRFCRSIDFGETFLPGVDVGVHDDTNTAVADGVSGQFGPAWLSVLPTSELYVNGTYSPGSGATYFDWYTARLSSDGGRIWRAASQINSAVVSTHYVAATFGAPAWVTRGGYEGSKGAGGQSAGAHRFLKIARSSVGGAGVRVESLDSGDTWIIPSDLAAAGSTFAPSAQPVAVRGVSYDGISWSADDYQSAAGYHALTDFPRGVARLVMSADTDVTYRLYGVPYGAAGQLALFRNRNTFDAAGTEPHTETLPCWWSPSKDGTGLLPIPYPGDIFSALCWQWKGRIVVLTKDPTNPPLVQIYVSDNENGWYRKSCHSTDAGATWVTD